MSYEKVFLILEKKSSMKKPTKKNWRTKAN